MNMADRGPTVVRSNLGDLRRLPLPGLLRLVGLPHKPAVLAGERRRRAPPARPPERTSFPGPSVCPAHPEARPGTSSPEEPLAMEMVNGRPLVGAPSVVMT